MDKQKITLLDRWFEEVSVIMEKENEGKEYVLRCIYNGMLADMER